MFSEVASNFTIHFIRKFIRHIRAEGKVYMIRNVSLVFVFFLVAMTVACGGHRPPQTNPELLVQAQPVFVSVPSCEDLARFDDRYVEWAEQSGDSCTPGVLQITDMAVYPPEEICEVVIKPGPAGRRLIPATWAHYRARDDGTKLADWTVSFTAMYSYVTDDRLQGKTVGLPSKLAHAQNRGWFIQTPCPR